MAINKNGEAFSAEYQAYYDKRTKEFSDGTKALENLKVKPFMCFLIVKCKYI